jgi:serine/threonine protein kinase
MNTSAQDLFVQALEMEPAAREVFLARACGEDAELRLEVQRLLVEAERADSFFGDSDGATIGAEEFKEAYSEKPGDQIGPYKLREQIGEGGFGSVWVADQEKPVRRRVALKLVKAGMDTKQVIARFEQERQALAVMDHPNIAKVLDAGTTGTGRPYFVMELVRGTRITDYCDEKQLPTPERIGLFIAVCQAVQHAHQKGIIHRDLKPSNILVTIHDGRPMPKVIDFGVAKATQGRLSEHTIYTQFQQMIGTPLYMSPEQADMTSQDVDTRSDIYSLGVLLYELLTGGTPIDAATMRQAGLDEMRRMIREVDAPRPSLRLKTLDGNTLSSAAKRRHTEPAKLPGTLKGDLDWIVMKCLEKDRQRRYDTANGLVLDLQRHLNNEVITARPPTTRYLIGKLVRRNKLAFAAASAVTLALLIGIVASMWQAIRATRAEKAAQAETERAVAAEKNAREETQRATQAEALASKHLTESEQARKDAEAISAFLTGMFESSRPGDEKSGREVKVVDVLDIAAKKLDTELAEQPERRAQLQATLGRTYHTLGLYQVAIDLFTKARDWRLAHLGPDHHDTLKAMQELAWSNLLDGRRDTAIPMQEEVLARCRRALGGEHPLTITVTRELALSYYRVGRREEALKLREEMLPLCRRMLGDEHPDTIRALRGLAESYGRAGRKEEARKLREELVTISRKVYGTEHSESIGAMIDLAKLNLAAGQQDDELKQWEEALALARKVLGDKHPQTLNLMIALANSYFDASRMNEALKLREEVLKLSRDVRGDQHHPNTLVVMAALADSYDAAGRKEDAQKLRDELKTLQTKANAQQKAKQQ